MQIRLVNGKATWKAEWKEVGGKRIYFRSRWEYRYCLYLEYLKKQGQIVDWFYEPKVFWFEGIRRGTNNYKPDFLVVHTNASEEYVEVKGYMDAKSKTKIKRMAKYHPTVRLRVVTKEFFTKNGKMLRAVLRDW